MRSSASQRQRQPGRGATAPGSVPGWNRGTGPNVSGFHRLRVRSVRRETRHAVRVSLEVAPALASRFRFRAGQYLTVRRDFGSEELRRTYSICSGEDEGTLEIGVKRVHDGVFSTWANEELDAGGWLDAMPPMGRFSPPADGRTRHRYLAFAAGSGITPILSIAKTVLAREPESEMTLFYGNRASATIMFREDLEDLKNRHLGRFNLVFVLSREQQEIELFNGRLDAEKVDALLTRWAPPHEIDAAFVCGPGTMADELALALPRHGIARERISVERFRPGARASQRTDAPAVSADDSGQCTVEAILDGRRYSFQLRRGVEAIIDAAERQGIALPYSCRGGICSTCRARLVEGEVDMDATYALEDYEIARGFILCCQSHPATDRVVVDFDHPE